jgi:hypothetical protein
LTIATAYKYEPICDMHAFVPGVMPVLEANPNAVLLAVGPRAEGQWAQASDGSRSRVRAYGRQQDTSVFRDAADIYLDSFPFGSTTSTLEAGLHGMPLVAFCPEIKTVPLMYSDCPGTLDLMIRASEIDAYRRAICDLIQHPLKRRSLGEDTARSIRKLHVGAGWMSYLERLYNAAEAWHEAAPIASEEVPVSCEPIDTALHALHSHAHMSRSAEEVVRTHAGLLSFTERLRAWRAVRGTMWPELPRLFWPEGAHVPSPLRGFVNRRRGLKPLSLRS